MFLHLGDDVTVRTREIISIHDYTTFQEGSNRECLEALEKAGKLTYTATAQQKTPKSVILTETGAYLSVLSPGTLKGRGDAAFQKEEWQRTE